MFEVEVEFRECGMPISKILESLLWYERMLMIAYRELKGLSVHNYSPSRRVSAWQKKTRTSLVMKL